MERVYSAYSVWLIIDILGLNKGPFKKMYYFFFKSFTIHYQYRQKYRAKLGKYWTIFECI